MQLHNVETHLYEPIIHTSNLSTDIQRLKLLHSCLISIKSYLDALLLFPNERFFACTFVEWAQLSYVLIILSTLSLLKDSAWDLDYVRSVVDLSEVLEQMAKRLRYVVRLDGVERRGDADGFERMAGLMDRMRGWVGMKRAGGVGEVSPLQYMDVVREETAVNGGGGALDEQCVDTVRGEVVNGVADAVDERFWQDIMDDWGELMDMQF
jgi:hypothetical protein